MKDFQIVIEVSNKNGCTIMRNRIEGIEVDIIDGLCHVFKGNEDLHTLFMVACLGSSYPFHPKIISEVCEGNEKIIIECDGGKLYSFTNGSQMSRIMMLSVAIKRSKGLTEIVENALRVFNKESKKKGSFEENVEGINEIIDEYKLYNKFN